MASVIRRLSGLFFSSLGVLACSLDTLLAKPNNLFFTIFTSLDHMALGFMCPGVLLGLLHFMCSFAKRFAFFRSAISHLQYASVHFPRDIIPYLTTQGTISIFRDTFLFQVFDVIIEKTFSLDCDPADVGVIIYVRLSEFCVG